MNNKPNYKTTRKYKCPYCDFKASRMDLVDHVEKEHNELIPEDHTAAQVIFDSINGKDYGTCMICKCKVYEWNNKINRYYNLCKNPNCKAKVREIALARHMKVYNKPTLLNDAEHQEKMLANRRISGSYTFSDGKKFVYTGKYEKNALEFMDKVLEIPSKDILTPGPVLEYEYNGKVHKWITDIFYIPANLIIEIKDGGNNPNTRTMTSYREKQVAKEVMITDKGTYNYIRLTNNDFSQLLSIFADMKNEALNEKNPKVKIHINESLAPFSNTKNIYKSLSNDERKIFGPYDDDKSVIYRSTKDGAFIEVRKTPNPKMVRILIAANNDSRGKGITDALINDVKKFLSRDKNIKYIYWECYKTNTHSYNCAIRNGFEVDDIGTNDKKWVLIYTMKSYINEEVGGLPPHRPPEAYIVPYGMNNVFNGLAYTDSDMDKMIITDEDDNIIPMVESVFYETFITAPALYYTGNDISEKMNKIHNRIGKDGKFNKYEFIELLADKPICKTEDILTLKCFKYYDKNMEEQTNKLLENGVSARMNDNSDIVDTVGNVYIHISPNGYYATTPEDFYLASEYFENLETLERSNMISIMNDIYVSNSKTKGEIRDV